MSKGEAPVTSPPIGRVGEVGSVAVYLDHGNGRFFYFELQRDGNAGQFARTTATHCSYHFTALGLVYDFDVTQVRRWLAQHRGQYWEATVKMDDGGQRTLACVLYDTFLRGVGCACRPGWTLS